VSNAVYDYAAALFDLEQHAVDTDPEAEFRREVRQALHISRKVVL
jgi:hypothetical protein